VKYLFPCKPNRIWHGEFLDRLDDDEGWVAEVKKNGWRCLPMRTTNLDPNPLTLWTRHHTVVSDALPALRSALANILPDNTLLDGELIDKRTKDVKGLLYLFDVIWYNGKLVTGLPLVERRKILDDIVGDEVGKGNIIIPKWHYTNKKELYEQALKDGDEGIVIKKLDSPYITGLTSCPQHPQWLKLKARGK